MNGETIRRIPAEVYSRVVGYFRPVNQWHQGKQQEFFDRRECRILKPVPPLTCRMCGGEMHVVSTTLAVCTYCGDEIIRP